MDRLPQINPIAPDLSDRMLTLNLILKSNDVVSVRSCEVLGKGFRNRLSFNDHSQMEDVLVQELSISIRDCLEGLPEGAHVLSLPEFLVELPGLALRGLHVMIMEAKEGIRNAILRFREFIGAANSAFQHDMGFDIPLADHGEKLALNVLEDICLPILNLCHVLDEDARAHGHSFPSHLCDRAREFQFQTELLKRFIANARMEASPTPRYGLEAQLAQLQLRLPR